MLPHEVWLRGVGVRTKEEKPTKEENRFRYGQAGTVKARRVRATLVTNTGRGPRKRVVVRRKEGKKRMVSISGRASEKGSE